MYENKFGGYRVPGRLRGLNIHLTLANLHTVIFNAVKHKCATETQCRFVIYALSGGFHGVGDYIEV